MYYGPHHHFRLALLVQNTPYSASVWLWTAQTTGGQSSLRAEVIFVHSPHPKMAGFSGPLWATQRIRSSRPQGKAC